MPVPPDPPEPPEPPEPEPPEFDPERFEPAMFVPPVQAVRAIRKMRVNRQARFQGESGCLPMLSFFRMAAGGGKRTEGGGWNKTGRVLG